MGAELATLGTYPKANKKDKVYYANQLNYGFSVKVYDENGRPKIRRNPTTGQELTDGKGEPQYIEEPVMFTQWHTRFTDLGYWSVYVVTSDTPKQIADEVERMAQSNKHVVMTEKAFIQKTNPALAKHLEQADNLHKEREQLSSEVAAAREEKNKLELEISRLKQRAGIK